MTTAERNICKFPWESAFVGASIHEEDIDLRQAELEDATFRGFKSGSKPYATYISVDKSELFSRLLVLLWQDPHVMTDLQQVFDGSWAHDEQERAMAHLEGTAKAGDERAFLDALKSITWQNRAPADLMRAVKLALEAGAHLAARQLAIEGAERYPNDPQVQKYARLLAPPKVVSSKVRSDRRQRKANREWLRAHGNEYSGRWVAVRNGELLGASDSLEELTRRVGDTGDVLLTRVY